MSCVAPGCKVGYGTKGYYPPGVGTHNIPKDPLIRQKWIDAIPRANWKPSKHSRICSLHFDEDDYFLERQDSNPFRKKGPLKVRRLKPDAVPHIFSGIPPMIYANSPKIDPAGPIKPSRSKEIGRVETEIHIGDEAANKPPPPLQPRRSRKQLREGQFDIDSVMPWKLDFNNFEKDTSFWLWEQKWRTFYTFTGLNSHDEEYKIATLRSFLSESAQDLLDSLKLPPAQGKDVEYVLTALRIHAAKQSPVVNARMQFNLRHQDEDEVFDAFLVDLLTMAKSCEYCEGCRDSLIRDRLIVGLRDTETVNVLLKKPELNLQQTINICRVEEKRKMFPDEDPFYSTNQSTVDQSGWNEEPPKKRPKGRRRLEQRNESRLSDSEDHNYSMGGAAKYEEIQNMSEGVMGPQTGYIDPENGTLIGLPESKMIIVQDGDIINTIVELPDLAGQTFQIHDHQQQIHVQPQIQVQQLQIHEQQLQMHGQEIQQDQLDESQQLDHEQLQHQHLQQEQLQELHDQQMITPKQEEIDSNDLEMEDNLDDDPDYSDKPSDGHLEKEEKKRKTRPKTFEEYLSELGLENFGVKDRFLCHLCPEEFSTSTRMLNHIKNIHENKEPLPQKKMTGGKCKFCNSEFTLMKHLKKHIAEVHKDYKPFECKQCPAKFYQGGHLKRHIRILHDNERRFACDMCPRKFGERDGLLTHKRNVHEQQKCDVCHELFQNGRELRIHMTNIHPQEKPHLCETCGKSFGNQAILNNHVMRVHRGETSDRPHVCEACGTKFTQLHFLLYHIQKLKKKGCQQHLKLNESNGFELPDYEMGQDKGERRICWEQYPPKCKLCDRTFTTLPTLRSHLATVHAKTKNFECSICQKKFKTQKIMVQHTQSVHLGMKPYDCPHCSAKFGQLAHKNRHVRVVHQGLKEYVCDLCGKKYANKIDLNNHLKKVHNQGFTFDCAHCQLKFEKKRDLLTHLGNVHENEMPLI